MKNLQTEIMRFSEVLTVVVMKCHIFRDITPFSSLISADLSEEYVAHNSPSKNKPGKKSARKSASKLLHAYFWLGLISNLKMEAICSSEIPDDFQRTISLFMAL
jgi:hypothetical protein